MPIRARCVPMGWTARGKCGRALGVVPSPGPFHSYLALPLAACRSVLGSCRDVRELSVQHGIPGDGAQPRPFDEGSRLESQQGPRSLRTRSRCVGDRRRPRVELERHATPGRPTSTPKETFS